MAFVKPEPFVTVTGPILAEHRPKTKTKIYILVSFSKQPECNEVVSVSWASEFLSSSWVFLRVSNVFVGLSIGFRVVFPRLLLRTETPCSDRKAANVKPITELSYITV